MQRSVRINKAVILSFFMNKTAKEDLAKIIIGGILGLWLLASIPLIMYNASCTNEKAEINRLTQDRDFWKNQTIDLNETINNCTSLIQEQRDICNSRIGNATQDCETDKNNCKDNSDAGKIVFVIYTFSLSLGIGLSFNLFKIVFKIGLRKEWEEKAEKIERAWLITKIVLWVVVVLISLTAFISFLLVNPFKN